MSTLLLLHSDTTDGSTTFVDSSFYARTVSVFGDTHHETTNNLAGFGATTIQFDGSGDYLTVPSSTDFNFAYGDFTVDFWLWVSSIPGYNMICGRLDSWGHSGQLFIRLHPGVSGIEAQIGSDYLQIPNLPLNQWNHISLVRYGGTAKLRLNGVTAHTTAASANVTSTQPFYIGANPVNLGEAVSGYVDEFRITDAAEWTDDFTPPTEPYTLGHTTGIASTVAFGTPAQTATAAVTSIGAVTTFGTPLAAYVEFATGIASTAGFGTPVRVLDATSTTTSVATTTFGEAWAYRFAPGAPVGLVTSDWPATAFGRPSTVTTRIGTATGFSTTVLPEHVAEVAQDATAIAPATTFGTGVLVSVHEAPAFSTTAFGATTTTAFGFAQAASFPSRFGLPEIDKTQIVVASAFANTAAYGTPVASFPNQTGTATGSAFSVQPGKPKSARVRSAGASSIVECGP